MKSFSLLALILLATAAGAESIDWSKTGQPADGYQFVSTAAPMDWSASPMTPAKTGCPCGPGCNCGGTCGCLEWGCSGQCSCAVASLPADRLNYQDAYNYAMKRGEPLIVFVGQPARLVLGCVTCPRDTFPDCQGPCVVVGRMRLGALHMTEMIRHDIPGKPTDSEIMRYAFPWEPRQQEPLDNRFLIQSGPQFQFTGGGRRGGC